MDTLFEIHTANVSLIWEPARQQAPATVSDGPPPPGWLRIVPQHPGPMDVHRAGVPGGVASVPDTTAGPRLFEQTDYTIYCRAAEGPVQVIHRDPLLCANLRQRDEGRVIHGVINFGSQVGRSTFTVLVQGRPEFTFEVEVFPSKLDYQTDYEQMLAEVQDILTGLALEYLRATYRSGAAAPHSQPTDVEWLTLLRHVVDDLERALRHVSQRPIRGLAREPQLVPAGHVKRVDAVIRAAVRQGKGKGGFLQAPGQPPVRERVAEQRSRPTLDTPEHRWLAAQMDAIRRRLVALRHIEESRTPSPRRDRTVAEIAQVEARIGRLRQIEPLQEAQGTAPPGFTSLQLLLAPGYREAYVACTVLALGLRLTDGPLRLAVKDLHLLYEYWCFLALVRMVAEETGAPVPTGELFAIRQDGLQVLLERGRTSTLPFGRHGQRRIDVSYNRQFQGAHLVVPQKPDVVVTLQDPDWPSLHLVLDAKYRVDASPDTLKQYGTPSPPEDAINVLHRYRDAIMESVAAEDGERVQRTVVEAAAAFPYGDQAPFRTNRLWASLQRVGVGAIPLLPGNTGYLREWLRSALQRGGWAQADRVIPHRLVERAHDWRAAASEAVLVGVLRGDDPAGHLRWIREQRLYYTRWAKTQPRQFAARWVAFYCPPPLRTKGAVAYWAPVEGVDVMPRKHIATPWSGRRNGEELQVVYRLGPVVPLARPVINRDGDGRGQRFSANRWTSRLALERAQTVTELLLETEPEWRLYEALWARGLDVTLRAGSVQVQDEAHPEGRARFVTGTGWEMRYAGAAGFWLRAPEGAETYLARVAEVADVAQRGQ